MKSFKLAWRYVIYHRGKTLLMILCIVLTVLLPVALSILLASFNRQIVARARSTPLLAGAAGSQLDLAMHALYFRTPPPGTIPLGQQDVVGELGQAIPLHARITAGQVPVVGTTLEYFEFRGINLQAGQGLARLGDCVLGANAARRLGKSAGDFLLTDRDNVFDFAGKYPLRMRVRGVLEPTRTADDDVVFVDLKTAWVVEGYGHGHQDVEGVSDNLVLERDEESVTASAGVLPYTEITDENIGSFHFHGDFSDFPITALIVVPGDARGEALIQGRFDRGDSEARMCVPVEVIGNMMELVFRVKRFFTANAVMISISTALLLALVVALSIRLRQREMQTMVKIGCSRGTMTSLVAAELGIVFLTALTVVLVAALTIARFANELVARLLVA